MVRAKSSKPKIKRVTLAVKSEPGDVVFVAGDFNGWNPDRVRLTDRDGTGLYATQLNLLPGAYEYKFVINGTWHLDSRSREWVQSSAGTWNSVLRVE